MLNEILLGYFSEYKNWIIIDSDLLNDYDEQYGGCDPNNADTDNDRINDMDDDAKTVVELEKPWGEIGIGAVDDSGGEVKLNIHDNAGISTIYVRLSGKETHDVTITASQIAQVVTKDANGLNYVGITKLFTHWEDRTGGYFTVYVMVTDVNGNIQEFSAGWKSGAKQVADIIVNAVATVAQVVVSTMSALADAAVKAVSVLWWWQQERSPRRLILR